MGRTPVVIETGTKRVFASALDWPGLCRSARDEAGALEALVAYSPRYQAAVGTAGGRFTPLRSRTGFEVVERVAGDTTTDYGAPGALCTSDEAAMTARQLARALAIIEATFAAFDAAVARASGHELRKGPRGGGRTLAKIVDHLDESNAAYVRAIGGTVPEGGDPAATRVGLVAALRARAQGELPDTGPRGGRRWPAHFAARRIAWHVLDHAWEIEDRLEP